jgi:hypothetical protein
MFAFLVMLTTNSDAEVTVTVRVRNVDSVMGSEMVQIYPKLPVVEGLEQHVNDGNRGRIYKRRSCLSERRR